MSAVLCFLAVVYAFFAGLKTVADFDLGWQMATARTIWAQHAIPTTEVFSYTARGAEWIYPILSGILFWAAFQIGGYAAISWLCALSCVGAVAILAVGRSAWGAGLALLAVPVIAEQTIPRSGMFTVLLFAGFARILFDYFEGGTGRLWVLPVMMIAWVNLHLGFLGGFALMIAYLVLEVLELPFGLRRQAAAQRLRKAWPWLVATAAASLVNPWGWRVWHAVVEQEFPSRTERGLVQEFRPIQAMATVFEWRSPENAVHWMIGLALLAAAAALWRKRIGSAVVLLVSVIAVLDHARVSGPFVAVVCLVGGVELAANAGVFAGRFRAVQVGVVLLLAGLVIVRSVDLVTNRFYIADGQLVLFGAGPSWWLPERAASFLVDRHLPREVFSTFNLSSYLVWKLGDEYPDFDDGRYIPFGDRLFYEQRALARTPLDSPEWDKAAQQRNIRTVILPLSRFFSLAEIPLKQDCSSVRWKPVYMDTAAIIFVRRDALSAEWRAVPDVVCSTESVSILSGRGPAERYEELMNRAAIEYLLGNLATAKTATERAEQITDVDPALYLQKAELAIAGKRFNEAEEVLRKSLARGASDSAWYGLGVLYSTEQRYDEAISAFRESARLAGLDRYQRLYVLGKTYALARQPEAALKALDKAQDSNPLAGNHSAEAAEFAAAIAEVRAAVYAEMGDSARAVMEQQRAVDETPDNALRWRVLATVYRAVGRNREAEKAQHRSDLLQARASARNFVN